MYDLSNLQAIKAKQQEEALEAKKHTESQLAIIQLQETVVKSFEYLVGYLDNKQTGGADLTRVNELLKGVLREVSQIPKELPETSEQQFIDYTEQLNSIEKAISKLTTQLKNQPKPEQPIVNIPKTDFTPLIEALKPEEKEEVKEIELENYKAHDILDTDDTQYIGFVDPKGNWYIIKNKVNDNKLRYVFGKDDYITQFKKAKSLRYKVLSEAVSEI